MPYYSEYSRGQSKQVNAAELTASKSDGLANNNDKMDGVLQNIITMGSWDNA